MSKRLPRLVPTLTHTNALLINSRKRYNLEGIKLSFSERKENDVKYIKGLLLTWRIIYAKCFYYSNCVHKLDSRALESNFEANKLKNSINVTKFPIQIPSNRNDFA